MSVELETEIKLVTSKFSPYGHMVEMALIEKNLSYEKEIVDLSNKPDWFKKDAPVGKAPIIYVENKILFNSSSICEYLEDNFPENTPLHPTNNADKALHRAWMEYSNVILTSILDVMFSQDVKDYRAKREDLISKLDFLENYLENNQQFNPYFGGERFTLTDIFFICIFKPLTYIDEKFTLEIIGIHKHIHTYIVHLMSRTSLKKVIPNDYEDLFKLFLTRRNSHLLTMSFSI